jgi:hypothetical protein
VDYGWNKKDENKDDVDQKVLARPFFQCDRDRRKQDRKDDENDFVIHNLFGSLMQLVSLCLEER